MLAVSELSSLPSDPPAWALALHNWAALLPGMVACRPPRPPQGQVRSLEQIFLFSLPVKEYQVEG